MAIVWIPEGQEYSLEDIRKNPNKYQRYGKKAEDVDTSYGDMQNDSPKMKFEDLSQVQQQPNKTPDSSLWKGAKEAARIGTGALVSGISGLAGVPRGVLGAANSLINMTRPEVSPEVLKNLESHPELKSFATGNVIPEEYVPSGEDVKGAISKALPEDYLKSSGQHQDFINEVASDIGSMMFPIGGAQKIGKALLVSGAGNAAKYLSKNVGLSEGNQNRVKLGTMLITTMLGGKGLRDSGSEKYTEAESLIKPDSTIPSVSVKNVWQDSYDWIKKGYSGSKDKAPFKNYLDEFKERFLSRPDANIRDIIQFKKDAGKILRESVGNVSKKDWNELQSQISKFYGGINNVLKKSPAMPNGAAKLLDQADNIWSNVKQAEKTSSWIKSKANTLSQKGGGYAVLGKVLGGSFSPVALAASGVGAVGSAASSSASNTLTFLKSLGNNPTVAKEYAKMINAALKENTPVFLKHANNLGNELKKVNNKPLGEKGKYYPPKDGRMGYYIE